MLYFRHFRHAILRLTRFRCFDAMITLLLPRCYYFRCRCHYLPLPITPLFRRLIIAAAAIY